MWDEVIEDSIESSKCVVTVWASESVKSGWVRAEDIQTEHNWYLYGSERKPVLENKITEGDDKG